MDENYTRVRLALDAAKQFQNVQVKNAECEAHELRVKYASSTGKMLEDVVLPPDSPFVAKMGKLDRMNRTAMKERGRNFRDRTNDGSKRSEANDERIICNLTRVHFTF